MCLNESNSSVAFGANEYTKKAVLSSFFLIDQKTALMVVVVMHHEDNFLTYGKTESDRIGQTESAGSMFSLGDVIESLRFSPSPFVGTSQVADLLSL